MVLGTILIDRAVSGTTQSRLSIGNNLFEECVRIGAHIGTIDTFRNPTRLGVYIADKDVIWICNGLKPESRNRVICHEMIHWTGHKDRLNRTGVTMHLNNKFNPEVKGKLYAVEEVIAELGSIILCIKLGLSWDRVGSEIYIHNYLQRCPIFQDMEQFFLKVSEVSAQYVFNRVYKSYEERLIQIGKMQEWLNL